MDNKIIAFAAAVFVAIIILIAITTLNVLPGTTTKTSETNMDKSDINIDGSDININESDINKFIGTWEESSIADENIVQTYIFYENGTFLSICIFYNPAETHEGWGDYNIDNGIICMEPHPHGASTDGDAYCYDYKFSNDDTHMTLSTEELPTVTLVKIN